MSPNPTQPNKMNKTEHIISSIPTVHQNGSSAKALVAEWEAFSEALQTTIDALPRESFHGRNHYPLGNENKAFEAQSQLFLQVSDLLDYSEGVLAALYGTLN